MRNAIIGVIIVGVIGLTTSCNLEGGTNQFTCDTGANESLFENPPEDTVYVKIEASDSILTRTFVGIRSTEEDENPVDGAFENLVTYELAPSSSNGRLYGLGTQIIDDADSSGLVIAFNLLTGSQLSEVCRSTKVFQVEHDWSKWSENVAGVEVIMTVPIKGEWVTFSSDASQEDDDILVLEGAEFLDSVGFYARLKGNFTVKLVEETFLDSPMEIDVSGSFIINMRVSR